MAAQSKLLKGALDCSCQSYIHPWTSTCSASSAGMLLITVPHCLRTYATVYLVGLLMRRRVPKWKDIKVTVGSILQSTAFLTSNSFMFTFFVCLFRKILGGFYFSTVAFWPAFFASAIALSVERPNRRMQLALYVANVGSETLWNMLKARGLVRSIPNGQVLIMGMSLTALLYLYRAGLHKTVAKDVTFKGLRVFIGPEEEGPLQTPTVTTSQTLQSTLNFASISAYVQLYDRLHNYKHPSCPHRRGCATYALRGGLKPLLGGIGFQVGLKLLLNIRQIIKWKINWRKQVFNKDSLKLGLALGSFSLLFKLVSCGLRHGYGHDKAAFAVPAGLIASIGLLQFPNTTVSLYIMWKSLQLLYSWGIAEGVLPEVPHFLYLLYSVATALIFHSAILEANSSRPSYYKFLMDTSGGRISRFNVKPFESYGLRSHEQMLKIVKKLKIDLSAPYPKLPITV